MDIDRVLSRTAPLAGLSAVFWAVYRFSLTRLIRPLDLVALATILAVLVESHMTAAKLARLEDQRGRS